MEPAVRDRLNNPYANDTQNTDEKRPRTTAERIVPISDSGTVSDGPLSCTINTIGHTKLSRPSNSVDHAQIFEIDSAFTQRNTPTTPAHPRTMNSETFPQINQNPTVTTVVPSKRFSSFMRTMGFRPRRWSLKGTAGRCQPGEITRRMSSTS